MTAKMTTLTRIRISIMYKMNTLGKTKAVKGYYRSLIGRYMTQITSLERISMTSKQ